MSLLVLSKVAKHLCSSLPPLSPAGGARRSTWLTLDKYTQNPPGTQRVERADDGIKSRTRQKGALEVKPK